MTRKEATAILTKRIPNLSTKQQSNLMFHVENETPIFRGRNAVCQWVDDESGFG